MKLKYWMDENGWTHAELASEIGVTRSAVTQWVNHHVYPTAPRMYDIYKLTNGAVNLPDWFAED